MNDDQPSNNQGARLYNRARKLIPGGTQLLSKRPEMFLPGSWPAYFDSASGSRIVDLEGREYLDFTHCAVGSCPLGYGYEPVTEAVVDRVRAGNMSTLNDPAEVKLAEQLLEVHPWADQVRYARTGGESMAVAVRIARAATGRNKVAICGYHGWHDWYLAANLRNQSNLEKHLLPGLDPVGVPDELRDTVYPFHFNSPEELEEIVSSQGDELAAIVMEPLRNAEPTPSFLRGLHEQVDRSGAVFILDEITAGWRLTHGGAHLLFDFDPHVAVFAKGISNGHPMGAIIGVEEVMDAAQESFISSTYWTESTGLAAALCTLKKHRELNLEDPLKSTGKTVRESWRKAAEPTNLDITVTGPPALSHFQFNDEHDSCLQTIFTQEMLDRGFLASNSFYPMRSHSRDQLNRYREAVLDVFPILEDARESGEPEQWLDGEPAHDGFRRLN